MEQAPLVYASKNQFGLHVTSGTAESPGLDISIGYKGLDLALVPVAVAKYCDSAVSDDCTNAIYEMVTILGRKKDVTSNDGLSARYETASGEVARLLDERNQVQNDIGALDIQLSQSRRKQDFRSELDTLIELGTENLSIEQQSQKTVLEENLNKLSDVSLNTDLLTKRKLDLQEKNTALGSQLIAANQAVADISASIRADRDNGKDDALSVYGTFEGSADGSASEANLTLGKVFATGVAAQTLAERVGSADCLIAVGKLVDKAGATSDVGKQLLSSATEMCKAKAKPG
ncbi:MAG: hypothetical protein Pars2KO_09430 [Parasphingorhabdus sp.]